MSFVGDGVERGPRANIYTEDRHWALRSAGALVWHYAAWNGNPIPTFRNNLSVPSTKVKIFKKIDCLTLVDGLTGCPKTSVRNYSALRNIPKQRRSHWHYGGNLNLVGRLCLSETLVTTSKTRWSRLQSWRWRQYIPPKHWQLTH
jgi:hypothetical protein